MHPRPGLALLVVVMVALAACGNPSGSAAPSSGALTTPGSQDASASGGTQGSLPSRTPDPSEAIVECGTKLKVGLVTETGAIDDHGFNQSALEGLQAATAQAPTCFESDHIELKAPTDYAANVNHFTDAGYDIVIGVGSRAGVTLAQDALLADAMGDASKANSSVRFIAVDGAPDIGHDEAWETNGESLFFAEDEAGYLAGVLAASMSKAKHIGVVGGPLVVPPVERFVEGYVNGARSVDPKIAIDAAYTTSFADTTQGRDAANDVIAAGADVVFSAAGLSGDGALTATCKHKGVYAIGVDTDQFLTLHDAAPCILSSAMKGVELAVAASLGQIAIDKFTPGYHTDDAASGGIGLAPFHDHDAEVSPAVRERLATTVAGLADGSIKTGVVVDGQIPTP